MSTLRARALAQEIASRYYSSYNPYERHRINVEQCLREPVMAVTINILTNSEATEAIQSAAYHEDATPESSLVNNKEENGGGDGTWQDPLATTNQKISEADLPTADFKKYHDLHRRSKARMEAFLDGVVLAVGSLNNRLSNNKSDHESDVGSSTSSMNGGNHSPELSLADGLKGFGIKDKEKESQVIRSLNMSGKELLRSISSGRPSSSKEKQMQLQESDLTTRLELYIRSLFRVKSQCQECVLAAEPPRALKARAVAIVDAFVDTVSTVRQQSPILTRLLTNLTKELLAVEYISPDLNRTIRRLVSDYEQQTSFASLAFLSTPDDSAHQRLTPMIIKFIKFLQAECKNLVTDCELERMVTLALDPTMRKTFKTIEFQSIGHLLETCADFRSQLQKVELAPVNFGDPDYRRLVDNPDAVRQAIRDLQRERITVNGHLLPPVTSRKELIHLLQQTMNSRTLTAMPIKPRRKKNRSRRKAESGQDMSENNNDISESSATESDFVSSSAAESDGANRGTTRQQQPHNRNFHLSTIDALTKRLLVAASRTGTGGDAYFVVRDLFGGEDVEVIPSDMLPTHGRAVRPGTIEILVRLASVTIKCHASFDVYPKSMVRACEPLIQLHTTTTETISLREVRACDSMEDGGHEDDYDTGPQEDYETDQSEKSPQKAVMVLQEREMEKSGWRILAIRPALYEKVEVWNTPS